MPRNVVSNNTPRCSKCRFPSRWCVCAVHEVVPCALAVDVLMHEEEFNKPTSTGHLIQRVVSGARQHIDDGHCKMTLESIQRPDKELWILHPRGEAMPEQFDSSKVQVLLIDGSWKQSVKMMRQIEGWGRRVRLPIEGESRYWLRTQHEEGNFSTVEALLFLLKSMGLTETYEGLQLQFELHVYAGLRLRGNKALADRFLAQSPLVQKLPGFLSQLCERRPNEEARKFPKNV